MAFSNYMEGLVSDWLTGSAMPAAPAGLYVGLFTSDPTDAGGGGEVTTTVRAAGRAAATFGAGADDGAGGTKKTNTVAVDFGQSAGDVAGTVTHFGIFDAGAAGNLLLHGALDAAKPVTTGDPVVFPIGSLSFTVR